MKTTKEKIDLISLSNVLDVNVHVLREQFIELEIINKKNNSDELLLTKTAIFYNLGEIKTSLNRKGKRLQSNVYNVDEMLIILNYNMPLTQLFEAMYPDDEEQDILDIEPMGSEINSSSHNYIESIKLRTIHVRIMSKYRA